MTIGPARSVPEREPESASPVRARRLSALGWTVLVALVAMASSLAALVFTLWPGLRPDPRDRLGAEVSVFAVDPNVTYREWITARSSFSGDEAEARLREARLQTPGLLRVRGEVAYVRMEVEGFKRRSVAMRVSLYEGWSNRRVEGASNIEVGSQELEAPSDRAVVPVWLPCPPEPGRKYYVRVELYHAGDNVLLAVADSEPFTSRCS
jgi:hypothetical protein